MTASQPDKPHDWRQRLSDAHLSALLEGSGISEEVASARGYWTATTKTELGRLGFKESQRGTPALVLPVWGVGGDIVSYQARPDAPRVDGNGKVVKYETLAGSRMVLDVHPHARPQLSDPSAELWVTEGIKKGDTLVSQGLCAIALLGVWNWRGTNSAGGTTALSDWEYVALNGRQVYVVFDSDVMTKPEVHRALARLKSFLEGRGARVSLVYLPPSPGDQQ